MGFSMAVTAGDPFFAYVIGESHGEKRRFKSTSILANTHIFSPAKNNVQRQTSCTCYENRSHNMHATDVEKGNNMKTWRVFPAMIQSVSDSPPIIKYCSDYLKKTPISSANNICSCSCSTSNFHHWTMNCNYKVVMHIKQRNRTLI